jgi:hypothetical protein
MASKWVVSVFLRESWRWNRGKNLLLLPLRRASRGRRRHGCRSKRHCFKLLFFFVTVHETTSFFPKRAVSFKWILEPKRVRFKIKPSICVRFAFWSLVSDFFN